MKKYSLTFATMLVACSLNAQNIQVHHDFGRDIYSDELPTRPRLTITLESYKPDRFGNTYFFVDMDLYSKGMAGAYTEISREFNFTKNKQFAAHIEYDGGLSSDRDTEYATKFQHSVLVGPAWNWSSSDFSKTFSVQLMYKQYFTAYSRNAFSSYQATMVWGTTFANKLCTFSGFLDIWYDNTVDGNYIISTEPQFWVNLNAIKGLSDFNLSIGTEVEISNNFIYTTASRTMFVNPTIALKWTF